MATLTIRKLDDAVYARLGERARRNNRSLEAEAREILNECSQELGEERGRDVDAWIDNLDVFQAGVIERHGVLPDSLPLIREMRDE